MPTEALTGAEDYFAKVLKPNTDTFFGAPSTFQNALNLATSLYYFHEWLWRSFQSKLEQEFGVQFQAPGAFWRSIEAKNKRFGYIRDVANASKHVRIGEVGKAPPSTGMTHIANTVIITTAYGEGAHGARKYGGGPEVFFEDEEKQISFDDCAAALFTFWDQLLAKVE